MKINISGLSEGVHPYVLHASAAELGLEPNFTGDVTATITLEKSVHQILASVKASVKGIFICDRCAEEFEQDITAQYAWVFSWQGDDDGAAVGEEEDDFTLLGKDDNHLDLSGSVREYLMLSVPVKLLCPRNCELPAQLQADGTAADPRWEKLSILRRTENN